jgi:hypothetical protein
MEIGTQLQPNKLYYTKSGTGQVIPFNLGWDRANKCDAIMIPYKTETSNVWSAGIARHIKDIAETKEEAEQIKY